MTSLIIAALLASFACMEVTAIDLTSVDYDKTTGKAVVCGQSENLDTDKLVIHLLDSGVDKDAVSDASDEELLGSTVWFHVDELSGENTFELVFNMKEITDKEGKFTLRVAANGEKTGVGSFSFYLTETMDEEIQKALGAASVEEMTACMKKAYDIFVTDANIKSLTDKIILSDDGSFNAENISEAAEVLFSMKVSEDFASGYDEFEKHLAKALAISDLSDDGELFKAVFLNHIEVFESGNINENVFKGLKKLSGKSLEIIADDIISLENIYKTDEEFNNALEFAVFKELMSTTYGSDGKEEVLRIFGDKLDFTVFEKSDNDCEKVINNIQKAIDNVDAENFDDIQKKLDTYIEESSDSTGKGGGGSGSSSGGGSGYVPGVTGINTQNVTKVEDSVVSFDDIGSVPWAAESIKRLAQLGIINGIGDAKFAPNDNVTRAQFAKILCNCFGILTEGSTSSFSDVDKYAWYAPYVSALERRGIVNGMGDGRFGVDEYITRQDMAVIIYNAGKTIFEAEDASEISFSDAESIADYARQSVAALKRENLINGMEDGSFAPLSNATRAETAKLMDAVEKFVKKHLN